MIEVTAADVIALAPEFTALSEAEGGEESIDLMIEYAREWVNEEKWGTETKAKMAICFMAAHLLKDLNFGSTDGTTSTSAAGPITQERVGDLSRSYGQLNLSEGSLSDQLLSTTKYGKQFITLRRTLILSPMVT